MSGFIKECCQVPPVEAEYTPKGSYVEVAGLKTYAVGPEDAKTAIVCVYDVFGFTPQIIQGADILASQGYRVVMPDFCKGIYAEGSMFGPGEEAKKRKDAFFGGFPGAIHSQIDNVTSVAKALKDAGYFKIGCVGYCWGWAVLVVSQATSGFNAIAGVHPSFISSSDAEKIDVPLCLLPSMNEDMKEVQAVYDGVEAKNPGKNFLKLYDTMPHGWLAARADLKDPLGAEKFREGYTDLCNFFKATVA